MKSLSIILLSLYCFFSFCYAGQIQSEFRPSQEISTLKEGDIIEVMLRFWPIENADLEIFKNQFQKKQIFNAFYVAEITSLTTSTNNADVVELKALMVIESTKPQPIYSFKYKDDLIELNLPSISIVPLKEKQQSFFVLDQSLLPDDFWKWVVIFSLIAIVLIFTQRNKLKVMLLKMKPDSKKQLIDKYKKMFQKASQREDFEEIYRDKDKWLALLVEKTPAHIEFFKVLNLHQFKKNWTPEDLLEVKSSFEIIKRSFE